MTQKYAKTIHVVNRTNAYFTLRFNHEAVNEQVLIDNDCHLLESVGEMYQFVMDACSLEADEVECFEYVIQPSELIPSEWLIYDSRDIATTVELEEGETLELYIANFEN